MIPIETAVPSRPIAGATILQLHGQSMGTTWQVKCVVPSVHSPQRLQHAIQQQLDQVVSQMSHWEAQSDLSRFNHAPAGTWAALPAAFYKVLGYASQLAEDSAGAFDPTAGALVNAWGFGPGAGYGNPAFEPPTARALAAARASSGWRRLQIDPATCSARQPGGLHLDLSAIAKGFGVDQVALHLSAAGIASFLVEVGGELRGAGTKPDGQPWWVALEQPGDGDGAVETIVALHNLSIATSGDYRRFFESGGARYCHTIDPRTGQPVAPGLASVTVLHADCMAADALSTALMVMGVEEGIPWAERRGLAALFRTRSGCPARTRRSGDDPARSATSSATTRRSPLAEHMTQRFADLLQ